MPSQTAPEPARFWARQQPLALVAGAGDRLEQPGRPQARAAPRAVALRAIRHSPPASRQATRWRSPQGRANQRPLAALDRAVASACGLAGAPAPHLGGHAGIAALQQVEADQVHAAARHPAHQGRGDPAVARPGGGAQAGGVLVVAHLARLVLRPLVVGPAVREVAERRVGGRGQALAVVVHVARPARALAAVAHEQQPLARGADLVPGHLQRQRVAARAPAGRAVDQVADHGVQVGGAEVVARGVVQVALQVQQQHLARVAVHPRPDLGQHLAEGLLGAAAQVRAGGVAQHRPAQEQVHVQLQAAHALVQLVDHGDPLVAVLGRQRQPHLGRAVVRVVGEHPRDVAHGHVPGQLVLQVQLAQRLPSASAAEAGSAAVSHTPSASTTIAAPRTGASVRPGRYSMRKVGWSRVGQLLPVPRHSLARHLAVGLDDGLALLDRYLGGGERPAPVATADLAPSAGGAQVLDPVRLAACGHDVAGAGVLDGDHRQHLLAAADPAGTTSVCEPPIPRRMARGLKTFRVNAAGLRYATPPASTCGGGGGGGGVAEVSGVTATSAAGAGVSPRSAKYRTDAVSAAIGAVMVLAMTSRMMRTAVLSPPRAPSRRRDDGLDQEDDQDDPEDGPAVALHELAGAAEGLDDAGALEHDDGRDDGPDGQQEQAGDDEQQESDAHAEALEQAGKEQGQDDRRGRAQQVARGVVADPVLDVVDELDDHALVEGGRRDADQDDQGNEDERQRQQAADDSHHEEQPERNRQQHRRVLSVDREDPVEYAAYIHFVDHAGQHTPLAGRSARIADECLRGRHRRRTGAAGGGCGGCGPRTARPARRRARTARQP